MGFFDGGYYEPWRMKRINKLVSVLGEKWFKGKNVLELACGHGHTGFYLKDKLGAIVEFTDGNPQNIQPIRDKVGDSKVTLMDQDSEWDSDKVYDLIIHWGVLYHLNDWERDLRTCFKYGRIIALETEVYDSTDPSITIHIDENWYDGAVNKIGSRMTPASIERIIRENNSKFVRYDDSDLNESYHKYDWKEGEYLNSAPPGVRRYWIIWNDERNLVI